MKTIPFIAAILLGLCIMGCSAKPDPYTSALTSFHDVDAARQPQAVETMFKMMDPEGQAKAALVIHPPPVEEMVKMQTALNKLDAEKKATDAALASEIARRKANDTRAAWIAGIGATMLVLGVIGAIVAKLFLPAGVGEAVLLAAGGGLLIFIGMNSGDSSQFVTDHRNFYGWSITAIALLLGGIAAHDYFAPPRGLKGMFLTFHSSPPV